MINELLSDGRIACTDQSVSEDRRLDVMHKYVRLADYSLKRSSILRPTRRIIPDHPSIKVINSHKSSL